MHTVMNPNHTQEALIQRARNRDAEAFEALVHSCRDELQVYVVSRVGTHLRSRVEPEDIVQETCARAWDSIDRVEWSGNATFIRWLKGIARHVILQQAGRHENDALLYVEEDRAGNEPSPSRALRREERFDRLQAAVDRLPPDYRQAVVLVRLNGLQIKDAAAQMDKSPKAVTHLLARALKLLREDLGDTASLGLPARRFEPKGRENG